MSDLEKWLEDNKHIRKPARDVYVENLISFNLSMVPLSDFFDAINKSRLYSYKNVFIDIRDEDCLQVIRRELESDENYLNRLIAIKDGKDIKKIMRRQQYLELKREFGDE